MQLRNIHEKLIEAIQIMLVDCKVNLPYYGNFNLFVNFHENNKMPTCAVNMTSKGFNFFYNSEFLAGLSQKEVNFITLHEDFHLLWNHPRRTITGQYDPKLANIAQDMIINHVIVEDIPDWFIEVPKDKDGKNMALFVPKEYQGKLIFEELYDWLRDKQEERKKQKQRGGKGDEGQDGQGQDKGDQAGEGQDGGQGGSKAKEYGPHGKNPRAGRAGESETIDTYSLDQLLDDLNETQGQYMDQHMGDEVPEEMRESMVKDAMDRLQARGFSGGNIEQTLNKLRKKRKDYLSHIKRHVSNLIFGTKKMKTIVKPNRRQIAGVKGNRKVKTKINVILDTSGSMGGQGTFERVLSFVYRNDIEVNMIQGDTEVKWFENFKSKKKLETMKIHGLGGTVLQPSINYVEEHFNEFNTVVLSDGYTDNLDISRLRGNVLMISVGVKMPIARSNGKLKQIVLEPTD
jgi:predicted metal-dependent peptidase